ncbi:FecCD family ABC transporter permease [Pinisolibacter aquiterrae]|uniref:FecCD family ABC transporter permease n=1 Tax=Pinisolibacter aquiterrae TaxID=2815579 RepID=UPI001C3E0810|nr:iron chelate uptake ABC transporter family permease subunit [Pinisolibacter aquiterrae]MBV5264934.1 iron chelate uptake ABC transporter family permease subunit [Pinisolibacter aquiterrae]MCC8234352.1 iron ABC transporter permease [Pinisolibacter aquiterrae]
MVGTTSFHALPLAAYFGAIVATTVLARVGRLRGRIDSGAVLLAGLAFAALADTLLGLLVFVADDRQLRDLSFWTLGTFGGVTWEKLLVAPLMAMPMLGRALDALAFGQAEARHMGIRVERAKTMAIAVTALGVGASVALVGIAHRALSGLSTVAGGLLIIVADLVARTVVAPAELPIGILTAAVGAPIFLPLLMKNRGGAAT